MSMSLKQELRPQLGLRMTPRLLRHIAADALESRTLLPKGKDNKPENPGSGEAGNKLFPYAK